MKKKAVVNEEVELTILKTATCPTLTGRSTLTYDLGKNVEGELFYRIIKNSPGGGFFSDEWLAKEEILSVISKTQPVTSTLLKSLMRGRSSNNPPFMVAVLVSEGILEVVPDKRRQFRLTAPRTEKPAATKAIPAKAPKSAAKKPKK